MRHTGNQLFTDTTINGTANENNTIVMNKLNTPLRRPIDGAEFGDLFYEADSLNITNYDNDMLALIDISNADLIKSFIVSEITFDDFFNYDKNQSESGSFYAKFDDFEQIDIDLHGTPVAAGNNLKIEISGSSKTNAVDAYTGLSIFKNNNVPIVVSLLSSQLNKRIDYMVLMDELSFSNNNLIIGSNGVNFDSTSGEVELDIVEIKSFKFIDNENPVNYVVLPPHKHSNDDIIGDINGKINLNADNIVLTNNGYSRQQDNLGRDYLIKLNSIEFNPVIQSNKSGNNFIFSNANVSLHSTFTVYVSDQEKEINKDNFNWLITDTTSTMLVEVITIGLSGYIDVDYQFVSSDPELVLFDTTNSLISIASRKQDISVVQPSSIIEPYIVFNESMLFAIDDIISITLPRFYQQVSSALNVSLQYDSEFSAIFTTSNASVIKIERFSLTSGWVEVGTLSAIGGSGNRSTNGLLVKRGQIRVTSDDYNNKFDLIIE